MFPHLYRIMLLDLLDLEISEANDLESADFYRIAESARIYIIKHEVNEYIVSEVKAAENPEAVALIIVALALSEEHPENPWPWREALTASNTEEEIAF